jgi:hypothetical protein
VRDQLAATWRAVDLPLRAAATPAEAAVVGSKTWLPEIAWPFVNGPPDRALSTLATVPVKDPVTGGANTAGGRGTGAVVCRGYDGSGRATPPASVNGTAGSAAAVAAGGGHSCAIQAGSGVVACWGSNSHGQAMPSASVNGTAGTAAAIEVGTLHSCAVQAPSGAVVCWGWNDDGQATPPASVDVAIAHADPDPQCWAGWLHRESSGCGLGFELALLLPLLSALRRARRG